MPSAVGQVRTVLDVGQSQLKGQIQALMQQIKGLDTRHQAALSALVWQGIKDKTQQDLLLQARQWQQHPDLEIQYLANLLGQVRTLPAGALQSGSVAEAAQQPTNIPPSLKPRYDALSKRVQALSARKAKALVGLIWQDTKSLTTEQLWNQEQDWKAHPQSQLAFLNHEVTTIEQADDKTVENLISDTPPEVFQAAAQAAKQGQGQQG